VCVSAGHVVQYYYYYGAIDYLHKFELVQSSLRFSALFEIYSILAARFHMHTSTTNYF
jgi:hypothetical protein